jgi:urea transporter/murein DD-endopeptidase MepM/ murein hydrolase activator NlpD
MFKKEKRNDFVHSVLNSYSQVFFSENKVFAMILLLVSFMDLWAGVFGMMAVLTSNITAYILGFNSYNIKRGIYGFNALLTGLGIGLVFQPAVTLLVIVFFVSILTLFVSIALQGILAKYGLPYLSVPFLIGIWIILLAANDFTSLGISERGIFEYNELYALGGKKLVDIYNWFNNWNTFESFKIYFLSLGAIFFQYNIPAGILIAIGLIYFSRISFMLSLTGFYTAWFFYRFTGANFTELGYTYIGFNYILTSIAIGSYFLLPTYKSFLWSILILPIVVIISAGITKIVDNWSLSVYSLPFNITVILFIYILKLRVFKKKHLIDLFVKQSNPEKTIYLNKTAIEENKKKLYFPVYLPFWGKWTVMQAHDGDYTHKQEWRHAWDFVLKDQKDKQFKNDGQKLEDYYCYSKSVIAPADGLISNIYDGVEDNKPGDINTVKNWGNSIVIQHTEYLYSQMSHLKRGSIKVKKGDYVRKGDLLALVGNSGHSPFPHVHFQIQSTPYVGSQTIDYPISNYIKSSKGNDRFVSFGKPENNEQLTPAEPNEIISENFNLIPGQKILARLEQNKKTINLNWEVRKTDYNETYIYCKETKSQAFFFSDENVFYFQNFYGRKKSALFFFFKSFYSIKKINCNNLQVDTSIRPDLFFNKVILFFQDFISPFYLFLKTKYALKYPEKENHFSTEMLSLNSQIQKKVFKKVLITEYYTITINGKGETIISTFKTNKPESLTINTLNL